ncbi:MAG: hypothetical protein SF187_27120 [Deltaproteobacteria bacterium]|nr:hypothetical protein [Deltaproteobacteria bacterium]
MAYLQAQQRRRPQGGPAWEPVRPRERQPVAPHVRVKERGPAQPQALDEIAPRPALNPVELRGQELQPVWWSGAPMAFVPQER